jgi:Tol biopolymer transport system component/DNA-binding winged helix-turn-helix (wHTH) protein
VGSNFAKQWYTPGEAWQVPVPRPDSSLENSVRFGPFELDSYTGELRKHGLRLKISGQAIRILTMLLEAPGTMVTREALKQALWPGTNYGDLDHGLNAAVTRLREVLGDSAGTPAYVETVPGRGYRFIASVELGPQQREVKESGVLTSVGTPRNRIRSVVLLLSLATIVLTTGVFVLQGTIRRTWRLHELQNLRTVPLTSLPGNIASPSFSPDGSQIAFSWDGENNGAGFDLYVQVIGSSDAPHRLTNHPAPRLSAAWSPDGRNLAFSRVTSRDSGVYLIRPSGGVERKIADRTDRSWYGSEVSWSPDGKRIAFIDRPSSPASDETLQLYLLPLDGLVKQEVNTGCTSVGTPTFSHNGQYLAWICNRKEFRSEIVLQELRNQQIRTLKKTPTMINGIAWSLDDQRIVFSTDSDSGALREIEVESSREQNLSLGQDAGDIAIYPRGAGFAYVKTSYNVNIWRLDLTATPPHANPLIVSSSVSRAPSISPDGKKIAFESNRSGAMQIWVADADGTNAQQMTFFTDATSGTPRWSPDGSRIAFDTRIGFEDAAIYILDREGGPPRRLQIDLHGNGQPWWSQDGQWIYFSNGDDEGASSVWKVPATGGHAVRLSALGGSFPIASFDGSVVYFGREEHVWSVRPDGSEEKKVEGIPRNIFLGDEWFPAAQGIYFIQHPNHRAEINVFDFETKTSRSIYTTERPTPPWIGGMPVSGDGRWMLFPQEDHSSSDLMMMEGWK